MSKIETEAQLRDKLDAMGSLDDDQRKSVVCALIGHSRIYTACWGYQHCGRCGEQIGDNLASIGIKGVAIGHKCPECVENMKDMTWKDTYMVPDPFADEEE